MVASPGQAKGLTSLSPKTIGPARSAAAPTSSRTHENASTKARRDAEGDRQDDPPGGRSGARVGRTERTRIADPPSTTASGALTRGARRRRPQVESRVTCGWDQSAGI